MKSDRRAGRFADRVVIVTGGGSGVGAAAARRFADEGAVVIVADWSADAAAEVVGSISAAGGRAESVVVDVATPDGAASMVAQAIDGYGRLDVLHNNSFGMEAGLIEDISLDGWNETLRLTLTGSFLGSRAALPVMAKQRSDAIINTASVAGWVPDPGSGPYSVAKAGVMALTRAIAVEYASDGIRCNAVCPATVETPAFLQALGEATTASWLTSAPAGRRGRVDHIADDLRRMRSAREAAHLTGRLIQAAEVAALVAWLASDEASSVTGSCYPVDAGLTVHSAVPPVT